MSLVIHIAYAYLGYMCLISYATRLPREVIYLSIYVI